MSFKPFLKSLWTLFCIGAHEVSNNNSNPTHSEVNSVSGLEIGPDGLDSQGAPDGFFSIEEYENYHS